MKQLKRKSSIFVPNVNIKLQHWEVWKNREVWKKTYWILENCSQSLFDPHDWEIYEWLIYPLFWIISHKRYRCKLNRDYWLFYIPNWQKQMLNKKCLKGCCLYISCMDCEWWLICGSDLPKHIRYDYSKILIVNLEWNM